jgi:hypothetical protein
MILIFEKLLMSALMLDNTFYNFEAIKAFPLKGQGKYIGMTDAIDPLQ